MTSTTNFRSALPGTTLERSTIEQLPTSTPQTNKGNRGPSGRRVVILGVAAAVAAVGIAFIVQDGSNESTVTPSATTSAVFTPVDASQGPNVDLPTSSSNQPTTAAPTTNQGPNTDLPANG